MPFKSPPGSAIFIEFYRGTEENYIKIFYKRTASSGEDPIILPG